MNVCGIICEYNPFHNGHKFHIEQTRKLFGATHIVAVMSGNFVQRGDLAIIDKYKRTEIALKNGVDLVIELPVQYSLASAEQFSQGAVYLLDKLGCINILSFGSECGDIELLKETAKAVKEYQQSDELKKAMDRGLTYPLALKKIIEEKYSENLSDTLNYPNNTLAIEYINAIDKIGSSIEPVTLKRKTALHDSEILENTNIVSASQIRRLLFEKKDVSSFTPYSDFSNIASLSNIENAVLSKLRTMNRDEIADVPNVLMGLENRIYDAAREATSLEELFELIKNKRYTLSRIRRIVLSSFLGITKNDLKIPPSYVKILGMNNKGKEILSTVKCNLPINTSLAQLAKESREAKKQAELEASCDDQYALALTNRRKCGLSYTSKPIIFN